MEGSDRKSCCGFWLRSKEQLKTEEEINESVKRLIENLLYWSDPKFNDYFKCDDKEEIEKTFKLDLDIEDSFFVRSYKTSVVKIEIKNYRPEKLESLIYETIIVTRLLQITCESTGG